MHLPAEICQEEEPWPEWIDRSSIDRPVCCQYQSDNLSRDSSCNIALFMEAVTIHVSVFSLPVWQTCFLSDVSVVLHVMLSASQPHVIHASCADNQAALSSHLQKQQVPGYTSVLRSASADTKLLNPLSAFVSSGQC